MPLELCWYNISDYIMFYHIIWCLSMTLCIYNCHLFSFQYCFNFCILSKIECMSIYYHFKHDHESSGFQKLASHKWMDLLLLKKNCDYFLVTSTCNFKKTVISYFYNVVLVCIILLELKQAIESNVPLMRNQFNTWESVCSEEISIWEWHWFQMNRPQT